MLMQRRLIFLLNACRECATRREHMSLPRVLEHLPGDEELAADKLDSHYGSNREQACIPCGASSRNASHREEGAPSL